MKCTQYCGVKMFSCVLRQQQIVKTKVNYFEIVNPLNWKFNFTKLISRFHKIYHVMCALLFVSMWARGWKVFFLNSGNRSLLACFIRIWLRANVFQSTLQVKDNVTVLTWRKLAHEEKYLSQCVIRHHGSSSQTGTVLVEMMQQIARGLYSRH